MAERSAVLSWDEKGAIPTSGCKEVNCKLRIYTCSGRWLIQATANSGFIYPYKEPCGGEVKAVNNFRQVVVNKKPEF